MVHYALYDFGATHEVIQEAIQICIDNGWLEVSEKGWRKTPADLIEIQRVAQELQSQQEAELARGDV